MLGPGLVLTGQKQRAETPRSRIRLNYSFHEHENMFFQKTRRRTLFPHIGEWQRGGAEGGKKRQNGAVLKPCLIAWLLETRHVCNT